MSMVSELLKKRIEELHLTVDQVAEYCGVNRATVYRWLNGEIDNMKRSNIASLSKILQLDPALIVGNIDDEVPSPVAVLPDFKTAQESGLFYCSIRDQIPVSALTAYLCGFLMFWPQNDHIFRKKRGF